MAYRPPDKTVSSFIASTSGPSTIDNQGMSQRFLLECPVEHLNNALLGNGKRRTNKPLLMHTLHSRIVSGTSPTLLLRLQYDRSTHRWALGVTGQEQQLL